MIDTGRAAFVHPSALIYGRVTMHEGSSIWCNAVIRSEAAHVEIGAWSNIQDFVMRTQNSWIANRLNALFYHRNALAYARGDHRAWDGPEFEAWIGGEMARLQREYEAL